MTKRCVLVLSALALLGACSQPADRSEQVAGTNQTEPPAAANSQEAAPPAPLPSASPQRPNDLISAEERENEACRGGSGDDPATMRACNRRQVLLKELQDAGWCWGGAEIEADKRFVTCKPGDPDYSPGAFDEPYFSDQDIAEAGNDQ